MCQFRLRAELVRIADYSLGNSMAGDPLLGFSCCMISGVGFAVNYLPVKSCDIGDGIFFSAAMSVTGLDLWWSMSKCKYRFAELVFVDCWHVHMCTAVYTLIWLHTSYAWLVWTIDYIVIYSRNSSNVRWLARGRNFARWLGHRDVSHFNTWRWDSSLRAFSGSWRGNVDAWKFDAWKYTSSGGNRW